MTLFQPGTIALITLPVNYKDGYALYGWQYIDGQQCKVLWQYEQSTSYRVELTTGEWAGKDLRVDENWLSEVKP